MAAIDTNVLVRFLVRSESEQAAASIDLIRRSVAAGEALFVPITVALELEWVLRSMYGFPKAEISRSFGRLLAANELAFQHEAALEFALLLWQAERAHFSDCVHVALAADAGQTPMWTFDKAASKLAGARAVK